jgi:hypothetical protein
MLAGCSKSEPSLGKLVPVQGKITLADGNPLPGGHMIFIPINRDPNAPSPPSDGNIQADGSYALFTKGQPGVPLGKYRVVLSRGVDKKAWNRVHPQYFNQETSSLEVEVAENKPEGGYDLKLLPRSGHR